MNFLMTTSLCPRPATRRAVLRSAGYAQLRFTHHKYVDTREAVLPDHRGQPTILIWEHVFACEETGEERRWGAEPRYEFKVPTTAATGEGN